MVINYIMNEPTSDCQICPRLADFRTKNRETYEDYYNNPVPSFGDIDSELLIVGLAPGVSGANATGRPFTGDYAGKVLYKALLKYGLANGKYQERADDGFQLNRCRVTNAVRCVPPQNKPIASEIKNCNAFLKNEIHNMSNIKAILSLGRISHNAVLSVFGLKQSEYNFGHGNVHDIRMQDKSIKLYDSYHTTRYNINTGRLTEKMFQDVISEIALLFSSR